LNIIATPMLSRNTKGTSQLSSSSTMAAQAKITARPTYVGSSASQRSFRSVTSADMPDTKQRLSAAARISRMASMVTSAEVALSKKTAIIVAPPELKALYSLSGSNSIGTETSDMESYHSTVST